MRGDALRAGGIQVPEAKGGKSPLIEVAAEILDDLGKIATPGSVLGTEAPETVYRRFNAWLRFCGLQGTLAAHALRHARLQQYRSWLGVEVAAAAGGHQTTDMVQQNYTAPAKVVPMLVPWERAAIKWEGVNAKAPAAMAGAFEFLRFQQMPCMCICIYWVICLFPRQIRATCTSHSANAGGVFSRSFFRSSGFCSPAATSSFRVLDMVRGASPSTNGTGGRSPGAHPQT
jgi:hypothetical protein